MSAIGAAEGGRLRRLAAASLLAGLLAGLLALAPACESGPTAPPAALWTPFTFERALAERRVLGEGLDPLFPAFPASAVLTSPTGLRVGSAFAGGRPAAYVTTDFWVNYPVVWVQPMYILVTAWDAAAPAAHRLRGANGAPARPIFSVGPRSRFWSPFWQVFYVVVPRETGVDEIRTTKQVLDGRYPLHPGPGRLCAAVPRGLRPDTAGGPPLPQLRPEGDGPFSLDGTYGVGEAWVDGEDEPFEVLDFGTDRFEWNERREVIEQPIFYFHARNDAGAWRPIAELPRVGGTGPLFARRPALAPDDKPLYGSLWRLWAVRLPPPAPGAPPRATLFLPRLSDPAYAARRAELLARAASLGLGVAPAEDSPLHDDDRARAHALKVAWNPACFTTGGTFPDGCAWLDSQEALEEHLPTALAPSGVLVTCPFVMHDGRPVRP